VPFADGLDAISRHANSLGYDGVVLFLDELILWFASRMADPDFVNKEGQKVAKLVEAPAGNRPAPIVSFIARQRDLREFIGQGVPGAEQQNFGDILQWWEGRFDVIELLDTNLRAIVEQRLLEPKSGEAQRAIDEAFERLASRAGSALDTLMTSDADKEAFRRVYPFSPAMIEILVAVSSFLQRERTALRLLQQLLVDKRDELRIGDLVPLGDLYDVIRGGEEPFSDDLKRHFVRARDLYRTKLRPMLLAEHDLQPEQVSELPRDHAFRTDDRLIKTLLLAALVPNVDPLQGLTVRRLADLNHGTIRTPVPGHEKAAVLSRLRKWAPEVPELQLEGDRDDPIVSFRLAGIDVQSILDQVRHVDNTGSRRKKIRELVFEALEIEDEGGFFDATRSWTWRGSRRQVDVRFGNVRDETEIPSSAFRAQGRPRVIIDFPFDEPERGPADDLARMQELQGELDPTPTVAWLPLFLTEAAQARLGKLVVLDHLLAGDRLDGHTSHLSPQNRMQAAQLLRSQADALRSQMRDIVRQAYGVDTAHDEWVRTDLPLNEQFPCLDPTMEIRAPTASNLDDAFEQILDRVMSHLFPAHPHFDDRVRIGDLRTALKHVERAVGARNQRVEIPKADRRAVRKVLGPLQIATTGENHIVLERHWKDHFHQKQHQNPGTAVTVERLKEWMSEPEPMGLEEPVANFVVACYTLMDNRVLVKGGQTVEPDLKRMEATTEVQTQELPSEEEWEAARPRAQQVFGVDASPILNANNVSKLVTSVKEVVGEYQDDVHDLVDRLEEALSRMGKGADGDRLRTARAARGLVDAVLGAEAVNAVVELVEVDPPTSAAALGRSIKSAPTVVEAITRARWQLFESVGKLTGELGEKGEEIRAAVKETLHHDELSRALSPVLDRQEKKAVDLLGRAATEPSPDGGDEDDDGGPDRQDEDEETEHRLEPKGKRQGISGDEAVAVLNELQQRSADLVELDVRWVLRD
jgi:hypothetical protein